MTLTLGRNMRAARPLQQAASADSKPLTQTETAGESRVILGILSVAWLFFFIIPAWGYHTFRSSLDLQFFDQGLFLVSRGLTPLVTVFHTHLLADHAAYILYPITVLYRIYPTVYWLFAIQALGTAAGGWPLWRLAKLAGLSAGMSRALVVLYLVYPVTLMAPMRDFHTDTIALPALLAAVLCVRLNRPAWFLFWVLLALTVKEVMSLTVLATGVWIFLAEGKRGYGVAAFILGAAWYVFATKWTIPHFGQGNEMNPARFYAYLGSNPGEIVRTMITKPIIPLRWLATPQTVFYVVVLTIPVIWGLAPRYLAPLLCAFPCVALNLLSTRDYFRSPLSYYSVPVIPFMFVSVIATVAAGRGWLKTGRAVAMWTAGVLVMGGLARASQLNFDRPLSGENVAARRGAIAAVNDDGGVLSSPELAAQLGHRKIDALIWNDETWALNGIDDDSRRYIDADSVDHVLIDNGQDPTLITAGPETQQAFQVFSRSPEFKLAYQSGGVFVFNRIHPPMHTGRPQSLAENPYQSRR